MNKFLIIIFSLLTLFAKAQDPYFRKYTLPIELRSEKVKLALQSQDNFLWFGTTRGLLQFDGLEYTHFISDSSHQNDVTALFEDRENKIWIGFKTGKISMLKDNKFQDFTPEEGFPKVEITGFAQDVSGNIWFSTYGEGVYLMANDRMYNFNSDDGLKDNYCYAITSDLRGNIWIGSDRGIAKCSFNKGKKTVLTLDAGSGLPDNIVTELSADSTGLWIGMESGGIARYNYKNFINIPDKWDYGRVVDIQKLEEGKLWIATTRNGLVEVNYNGNSQEISGIKSGYTRITDILKDVEGNIWVLENSYNIGITGRAFAFIKEVNDEPINNVQAILYSQDSTLWFSTESHLFSIDLTAPASPLKNHSEYFPGQNLHIISMYEDEQGNIWLGTFNNGIFKYNPTSKVVKNITEKEGLINNNVLSIAGQGDELWFATLGGVSFYKNEKFTSFTSQSGLGSNYIYQVFIDTKKRVWFATDGNGVTMLENKKFKTFSTAEGLSGDVVYSVTEDVNKNIWISTSNAGLMHFDGRGFVPYIPKNKLKEHTITSVVGDPHGNLLIVNQQGIDVLNLKKGLLLYHGAEAGLDALDPNLNSFSKDPNGGIWLGTQQGIIKYTPLSTPHTPITKLKNVLVFLEPVNDKAQVLSYDQNHVSFEYKGFWYHDPEEVAYEIKLEGYDRDWIRSRNNFITYSNLPPGDYKFHVRSSATGYFKDIDPVVYAFTIAPPFFKTWWFYGILIVTFGAGMVAFVKSREKKVKFAESQKKEQVQFEFETLKSQVNPHFLFNSFNTLIAIIEEDKDSAVEYVERLSDFYRNILIHREKNVISLAEELKMVMTYHFLQTKRYKNNFRLEIDIPENLRSKNIPPMTLQLLLENAVKHNIISKEKPLTVSVYSENDYLYVSNVIQERTNKEPSTGTGLMNIINRYRLLSHKEVKIVSRVNNFIIKLPLLD